MNVEKLSLKTHGLTWRLFSASEVLLGAVIVIGHNVYHVVPNEVPILFVLGLIALAAAVLRIVLGDFVIEPLAAYWWPRNRQRKS